MDSEAKENILSALGELADDTTVPKNIKAKIENMIALLNTNMDDSIKIDKALDEMESMTEDCNMQPYTRTQIFSVVSLLETVK